MSFPRAIPQALSCQACSGALQRTFAASCGANATVPLRAAWVVPRPLRRPYTSTSRRRGKNSHLPSPDTEPGFEFLESPNSPSAAQEPVPATSRSAGVVEPSPESPEAEDMSADSQAPPIPWYLRTQREALRDTSEQQSARELIPELPPNPPPLLQTLLEYISITAGLDDLVLFDLRHLDPPPALGSKLIMIIGTARSEKHLHVSADRFCRYLRREHGLKANAAGLLGRNELKIKLRRKAKRMKMLANVGGREEAMGNLDDGIRTGWICCTIGRMEAHPDDTVIPGTDGDNFVGFRDVKPGVNVVVQMFTEEKRAEIDLETLWGGVLKTHERQDAMAEDQLKELEEHLEGVQASDDARILGDVQSTEDPFEAAPKPRAVTPPHPPSDANLQSQWTRPVPTRGDVFPPVLDQNAGHQLRRLHTVGLARGL